MKNNCLFILLILTAALKLNAQNNKTYYQLYDLNKEWKHHPDILNEDLSFENETEKIQYHLNKVIFHLTENSPISFSKKQVENRNKLLNKLQEYSENGVFPTNLYHNKRTPYFVDDNAVHCAVAYMMQQSGNEDLVANIKKEHNYDYIADIKTEGISAWANIFGFTIDELKWIQPSYGVQNKFETLLEGTNNWVNKMHLQSYPEKILSFSGNFDSINNTYCSQIAYYDGESLNCYGNGLNGKINDITSIENNIYVTGLLEKDGLFYSIAKWNDTEWEYINVPTMEASESISVYKNFSTSNELYFNIVDPQNSNYSEIWNFKDNNWFKIASLRGKIYDMITANNSKTYYVGSFDSVFILNNTGLNDTLIANNIITKDYYNTWSSIENEINDTLFTCTYLGNSVYFGGNCGFGETCLSSVLNNDVQSLIINESYDSAHYKINDLKTKNNKIYVAGKFRANTMMSFGTNLAIYSFTSNNLIPIASLNKEIKAIAFFNQEQIVAGSFKGDYFGDVKYIAKLFKEDDPNSINKMNEITSISPNPFTSYIRFDQKFTNFSYSISNINGKQVKIGKIENNKIENLEELNQAVYFLKVYNNKNIYTSKIVKK